tara:strand:- start:1046 stop:1606 length:561 start_codon:yes stop_codon:yes gene_type:complete
MAIYKTIEDYLGKNPLSEPSGSSGIYNSIDRAIESISVTPTQESEESTAISSATGATDNRVSTFGSSTSLVGEPNLTFDGNKLNIQGGLIHKRREITTSTTLSSSDYYLACKITSTSTITLPKSNTLTAGQTFVFKDEAGSLSDSVILNLTTADGETIEGVATFSISQPSASIFIYTDSAGKYFIY